MADVVGVIMRGEAGTGTVGDWIWPKYSLVSCIGIKRCKLLVETQDRYDRHYKVCTTSSLSSDAEAPRDKSEALPRVVIVPGKRSQSLWACNTSRIRIRQPLGFQEAVPPQPSAVVRKSKIPTDLPIRESELTCIRMREQRDAEYAQLGH